MKIQQPHFKEHVFLNVYQHNFLKVLLISPLTEKKAKNLQHSNQFMFLFNYK